MHPGHVRSKMGGFDAPLTRNEGAAAVVRATLRGFGQPAPLPALGPSRAVTGSQSEAAGDTAQSGADPNDANGGSDAAIVVDAWSQWIGHGLFFQPNGVPFPSGWE